MSEDIRSKERVNQINNISETNKDDLDLKKIRDNLEKFVQDVLREENITPYELSRRTNTHETLWKNVLDGRTQKPDTGAIVALADYKNVPLDQLIGRDINKDNNIKVEVKQISSSIVKLPKNILQEAMLIGEKTREFMHKTTTKEKSFTEQIQNSNKLKGRSI
ncbi:XRE family transcriptional regulator [Rickettsia oklahomensis]|uniref:XRE family transcriptional regulator n=1 Tax=Rickettsia oklahomensis TaxID=3141789 RepID=A0AAU7BZ96_9RICK